MSLDPYPTEEELTKVTEGLTTTSQDRIALLEYVKSLWWSADWGWTESYGTEDKIRKYNISTGGWSGNESLMGALADNRMFWALCWVSTRRGGHYEFEIEESQ